VIKNLSPSAKTLAVTLEDLSHPIKDFTHWIAVCGRQGQPGIQLLPRIPEGGGRADGDTAEEKPGAVP